MKQTDISIVIPIYNEQDNISELFNRIHIAMDKTNIDHEVIFVNDGSTDQSHNVLNSLANSQNNVTVIHFRRNFGQTAAMQAGIDHSTGKYICFLDGDIQNDPDDIPKMYKKAMEGYDIVSGWRHQRKDSFLSRKLPSMIANSMIAKSTRVKLHDYGCSLKIYEANLLKETPLYGEMHRFIPALVSLKGAKITELKVNHYPRKAGKSKYGISRTFRVILDLITVKFFSDFQTKPIHIFGGIGMTSFGIGFLISIYLFIIKVFLKQPIGGRPLLFLGILLLIIGIQFVTFGLLAEFMTRIYFESGNKKIYYIRDIIKK